MKFPRTLPSLEKELNMVGIRLAKLYDVENHLHDQINKVVGETANLKAINEVFGRLHKSLNEGDPGKYGDAYFFVKQEDSGWKSRVAVREYLEDHKNDKVIKYYKIVPLSAVTKAKCPGCALEHPLIEHYVQTYDSPNGDTWLKEYLVVCFSSQKVYTLERKFSDERF